MNASALTQKMLFALFLIISLMALLPSVALLWSARALPIDDQKAMYQLVVSDTLRELLGYFISGFVGYAVVQRVGEYLRLRLHVEQNGRSKEP